MAESDWYLIIEDWEKSELTQQEFCIHNNLAHNDFKYWRTNGDCLWYKRLESSKLKLIDDQKTQSLTTKQLQGFLSSLDDQKK